MYLKSAILYIFLIVVAVESEYFQFQENYSF